MIDNFFIFANKIVYAVATKPDMVKRAMRKVNKTYTFDKEYN